MRLQSEHRRVMKIGMDLSIPVSLPREPGVYLVGGTVRDLILKRTPVDYDIVVVQNPEKFAHRLARDRRGRHITLGTAPKVIHRVIGGGAIFDVSALNGNDIETDLRRRDFTINAMAWDLCGNRIIDSLGAGRDLTVRKVRMVARQALRDDPIRLLRAYRLAATLNFDIDAATRRSIAVLAPMIRTVAAERIGAELVKIMQSPAAAGWIRAMRADNLLFPVLPELAPLEGCTQNRHHRFDALEHTLQALEHLERRLASTNRRRDPLKPTAANDDSASGPMLKLALLLHDIGKPLTRSKGNDGRIHFHGHAAKGADLAKQALRRLRFSNRRQGYVALIVRQHLRPLQLFLAHRRGILGPRGITRMFRLCGPDTPDLLLHALADQDAKDHGQTPTAVAFESFSAELLNRYIIEFRPRQAQPPLITGRDLIARLGIEPSPLVGTILSRIEDERLSGALTDRNQALALARSYLDHGSDKSPD